MSSNNEIAEYKEVLLPIKVPVGDYCVKTRGKMCHCQYFASSSLFAYCPMFRVNLLETSDGYLKPDECKNLKERE